MPPFNSVGMLPIGNNPKVAIFATLDNDKRDDLVTVNGVTANIQPFNNISLGQSSAT